MADRRWAKPRAISRLAWRLTLVVTLLAAATTSAAQSPGPKPSTFAKATVDRQVPSPPSIEVVPFGGYRIGGSGAAGSASLPVVYDSGGGVSFGALVDVPYQGLRRTD